MKKKIVTCRILKGHTDEVWHLEVSPQGDKIISASKDQTIRIWDAQSGKQLKCYPVLPSGNVSIALSPSGQYLAIGDKGTFDWKQTCQVLILDVETGQITFQMELTGYVQDIAYSPDGKYLAICGMFHPQTRNMVYLVDVSNSQILWEYESLYHSKNLAYSPDGKWVVVIILNRLVLLDTKNGKLVKEDRISEGVHHQRISFSPDGQYIGFNDINPKILPIPTLDWDIENWLYLFGRYPTFSPDWQEIAIISRTKEIQLWKIKDHDYKDKPICQLKGHPNYVTNLAYFPNGKRLASSSLDGSIRIWNIAFLKKKAKTKC